jgi:large subunit ribosomal protein L3
MAFGIIGKKIGMTRVFDESGEHIPVTVVLAEPNRVLQVKQIESDNYNAIQVAYGTKRTKLINKPQKEQYAKTGVAPGAGICEFRLDDVSEYKVQSEITLNIFENIKFVDVQAISKGKGFQGGVKRHNFHMQDATHGNSLSHRAIGSTGQNQSPGKVFKGKKMPGQMGAKKVSVLSQKLIKVDSEKNLLLIKGTVPGANGAFVRVQPAVKKVLQNNKVA